MHNLLLLLAMCLKSTCITEMEFCSCDLNSSHGDRGTYSWPEIGICQSISQMCQYGVVGQNITRLCNGNLTGSDDDSQCPTIVTSQFKDLNTAIQNVAKWQYNLYAITTNQCLMLLHHTQQTITAHNMVNITTQLQTLVSQATQEVDQSAFNLAVVANVISQISNISSPEVPIQAEVYYTPFVYTCGYCKQ